MISTMDVQELRRSVRGKVLTPGDDGFEQEAAAYNLATLHRPAIVVGVVDAADVVATMKWASAHGVPVAVQATGHGAETAMSGGLLINTSRLQDFSFDPESRVATAGAGVKWRKLIDAIVPHGLMGLNGSTTDVSVVGYTLGGGLPVMGRVFGFAADHVRSFDVVTADGQLRSVDATHEPELFALLRGGKGNLGVVTSITFGLFPLADFYAGGLFYPGTAAKEVLTAFSEWAPGLPENASTSVALLRLPDLEIIPGPMRNQFLVHLRFCHVGDAETGARVLAPMREVLAPMIDMVAPMSYLDIDQVHLDPPVPVPFLHAGKFLRDLTADAIPGSIAALLQGVASYVSGRTFVNLHGIPGDEADRARAWSEETYARLVQAKSVYDSHNLLRFQHVIGQDRVMA